MVATLITGVLIMSSLLTCTDGYERIDVRKMVDERKMAQRFTRDSYIRKRSIEVEKDEAINERDLLRLEPDESLTPVNSEPSSTGLQVKKLQETYKDVPVFDGIVTVETTTDGKLTGDASGTLIQKLSEDIHDVKPALNKDQILQIAIRIAGDLGRRNEVSDVHIELWIYPDTDNKAKLVYFVQYLIEGSVTKRPSMILDSSTGKKILKYDALETAPITSKRMIKPSLSLCKPNSIKGVGGNEKMGKIEYGEEPYCIQPKEDCSLENSYVRVVNMMYSKKETDNTQDPVTFPCDSYPSDGGNGAYSPSLDAYFYGTVIGKMYSEWIGGSPLKDKIIIRVNFGSNYANAFWNGKNATFGDGANVSYPYVSLDAVGHEIGHGVVERYSRLMYLRQSGGVNEAFADILGESAVAYLDASKPNLDWKIGAEITKSTPFMRSFDNPEADGDSISHLDQFDISVGVHASSGIFRFAFYTLVTKQNVSMKNAFRAFDRANKLYWHYMITFQEAACLVTKAAYDLGQDIDAYRKAFEAVGIRDCNLENHIRGLTFDKNYTNILVSKESTPLFKFEVPYWAANVTILTESNGADVEILVSNTSATDEPLASDINEVNFDYNGGETVYFRLKSKENCIQNVTLTVKYDCNLSWKTPNRKNQITALMEMCNFASACEKEELIKQCEKIFGV